MSDLRATSIADSDVPRPRDELLIRNERGDTIGKLIRVVPSILKDAVRIADLTAWRNHNRRFFLTQFHATESRTAKWLRDSVLSNVSRVLYLIQTDSGVTVGHVGAIHLDSAEPELDNMIRGRAGGDPQLMYWAEVALVDELFARESSERLCLHVFSHNWIPIGLHQSIGFEIREKQRLSAVVMSDEVHYLVDSDEGERQKCMYLRMLLSRATFEHFISTKTAWRGRQ